MVFFFLLLVLEQINSYEQEKTSKEVVAHVVAML